MKIAIRQVFIFLFLLISQLLTAQKSIKKISKDVLLDKIKGGWAGQTIGVTYGGPMEFRYNGTIIDAYQPIVWYDGYLKKTMLENPGLYDDLYMDLTFVEVFEKNGLQAPISAHANAYAHAGYALWHANQAGRYNILNGMTSPESGHWMNNPHADCIDYQIESDFAGLMSPGMPNVASEISDKIGHIMNYGDGYYGGVFIGACYSMAFVSNDVPTIIQEALKTIPKQSKYYQCIADVISWHKKFPNDWKATWFEIQKKWAQDISCPDGVFRPYNIDATINSAYVVLGLLYGNGDYSKTLDITTRCGQDADCNPSSAGGILGTMLGYEKIPAYWKLGLKEAEDIDFKYTSTSLNKVYEMGFRHALQNIENHGGKIKNSLIEIPFESPKSVKMEESFPGMRPIERRGIGKTLKDEMEFEFEGNGFVLTGEASKWGSLDSYTFDMEVFLDGKLMEVAKLPVSFTTRRYELTWKYLIPQAKHYVKVKLKNPSSIYECKVYDLLVYSGK